MSFASETEELMYRSINKQVFVKEKNGTEHKAKEIAFNFGDDNERGISTIALDDGTWLYEDQIESIKIPEDEE